MQSDVLAGRSYPLGATVYPDGVNFSVYSKSCDSLELLLFDAVDERRPARVIRLNPRANQRSFHYWHVFVKGLRAGQMYGFRTYGPHRPEDGYCFDPGKVLLDPYGRCVAVPPDYDRQAAARPGDNTPLAMKSVVTDLGDYDWEGDRPLCVPFARSVIYELHVGGFTRHPNSGLDDSLRGTYAGLVAKIPYLQDLGVTAVELLPVFHFDPQEAIPGLTNYWGYNPVSLFAPHGPYSSRGGTLAVLDEFRDMVKALHRAKIEVILDVVYNHTAEGNERGPTFCFKGLENRGYYTLNLNAPPGASRYANYTGTGNTLNANHAVVRRLILDSLRYWVREMHVDGFRFDLAAVLSRGPDGQPLANPPILWDIETDPILSGTKLIAEAWDAAGLYQVGSFFGDHWKEWNGRFRDDVRAFVRGDRACVRHLQSRLTASPDLFEHRQLGAEQSINFVTCHDGFTLNDLVSYNEKHNLANGEQNRDGYNQNLSWNCGVEGPTNDQRIETLRRRQIKNFFAINLLALGVPMILMGDEVRRTQQGNNNAYCQDNETSWFDWSLLARHRDIYQFAKRLIHFYRQLPFRQTEGMSLGQLLKLSQVVWHGVKLRQPDLSDDSHSLAVTADAARHRLYMIFNAYWEPLEFELPASPPGAALGWQRVIDTSLESPQDFCELAVAPRVTSGQYRAAARSVVLLLADAPDLTWNHTSSTSRAAADSVSATEPSSAPEPPSHEGPSRGAR
ncbi:MAG: glycogen debranching protein GlgX [Pirellulaceae bacterium]|nr:glycogen debranching protein GlgX [Pirellulaceae bacterium]